MGRYNTTQLYIDRAIERGIVHRDYLAHCLRWTHVLRHAKMGQRIIDIGCGINTPLAWTFYTNHFKPAIYVGLDYRDKWEVDPKTFNFPMELVPNFDVTSSILWDRITEKYGNFDIATCFEVIEHMPKLDGIKLLENISINCQGATIFLSTPCFNGKAAANHVYEWKYGELWEAINPLFNIEAVHGTFASQNEILSSMTPAEREVFDSMREYYDTNVLAIMFAPMHPDKSRNAIWRLKAK